MDRRLVRRFFQPRSGLPALCVFYQDRLGFAGTKKEPQTVWFSKTGEHEDFGYLRTLEDSDSISVNLSGKKLNAISSVAVRLAPAVVYRRQ